MDVDLDLDKMAEGSRKSIASGVFAPLLKTLSDKQLVGLYDQRDQQFDDVDLLPDVEVLFRAAFATLWAQVLREEIARRGR